jgi:hypothetical protein
MLAADNQKTKLSSALNAKKSQKNYQNIFKKFIINVKTKKSLNKNTSYAHSKKNA